MTAQPELLGCANYAPGKRLIFPYTGNSYVIVAVDESAQTVTFVVPHDRGDVTTETIADLESADAQVSR